MEGKKVADIQVNPSNSLTNQPMNNVLDFLLLMQGYSPQKTKDKKAPSEKDKPQTGWEYLLSRQVWHILQNKFSDDVKVPQKPKDLGEAHLPPLLKDISWTKASPFKEAQHYRSVSDSIANNYTPTASRLNIKSFHQKLESRALNGF